MVLAEKPEPSRITEIDIGRATRLLAVLRWSDYVLVVVCGLATLNAMLDLVFQVSIGQSILAGVGLVNAVIFGFAAYTGWRHVGVIDSRVWRSYLFVFPLLCGIAALSALMSLLTVKSEGWKTFEDVSTMANISAELNLIGIAIPGFVCVLMLRKLRIASMGVTLKSLLESIAARGATTPWSVKRIPRANIIRALSYGTVGVVLLLAMNFTPITERGGKPSQSMRINQSLTLLGCFMFVRARRYFQVSADSLLAVDKRAPILFLRSFADDERSKYGNAQRAMLDFSLETRLANHFCHFGPFIAIGSPKETVPQPGAARILLGNDEWQTRVLGWMRDASLIVMYCGKTHWVNWELRRVVECGRTGNLILMFPEIKTWFSSRRKKDIALRVEQVRDVFKGTPWSEELMAFNGFYNLRAMLFRPDGSMLMVKSGSRSRDAYHLAALVAHQQMLELAG